MLVILEDGSLLRLPAFYTADLAQGDDPEPRETVRNLLDGTAPVTWWEPDQSAPPPELLESQKDTIWWMLALCASPVAAASLVYVWKGREKKRWPNG